MDSLAGTLALNPVLGQSHAAYMIIRGIEAVAKGQDSFKSSKRTTIPSLFFLPPGVPKPPPRRRSPSSSGSTRNTSAMTEAVANNNGVKSAYFLQPVPAWSKTLTKEEKRVVGDLSYGVLYRRMVAGMMTLRERGLPIYDLGDIFATPRRHDPLNHIHYLADSDGVSVGNRLMAARIAWDGSEDYGRHTSAIHEGERRWPRRLLRGRLGFGAERAKRSPPRCGRSSCAHHRDEKHLSLLRGVVRRDHLHAGRQGQERETRLVHVEGDPDHPVNRGTLCPRARRCSTTSTTPTGSRCPRSGARARTSGKRFPGTRPSRASPANQGHARPHLRGQERQGPGGQPHARASACWRLHRHQRDWLPTGSSSPRWAFPSISKRRV